MMIHASVTKCALLLTIFCLLSAEGGSGDLPEPPKTQADISDFIQGSENLIINSQNAARYRSFIVPELFGTVRAGNMVFNAVGKLKYKMQPVPSPSASATPAIKPAELLLSVQNALSSQKILEYDLNIISLKENKLVRELNATFSRIYPKALSDSDKTGQVFKENLRITKPQPIEGFSWLTFRFPGVEEDLVWAYSPSIKQTRQITGSNRSDELLVTGVTLDDIFTWSGKPELVDAGDVVSGTYLVPFPDDNVSVGLVKPPCLEVKQDQHEEGVHGTSARWNFASRRYPEAAPWIPTNAIFIPRQLLRLELESRDPYSLYGRQILYVDAQTDLPIYKFVFDRAGHPWKTVFSAYGVTQGEDKKALISYYAFTVVDDTRTGESFIVDFISSASCSAMTERTEGTPFDPRKLGDATTVAIIPLPVASEKMVNTEVRDPAVRDTAVRDTAPSDRVVESARQTAPDVVPDIDD